jgi:hypothetical protein
MKALTLTEPWASLMMLGEKNIETRSWRTNHLGLIAIHAAKTMPTYAKLFCHDMNVVTAFMRHDAQQWYRPGCILCVRQLIDCVPTTEVRKLSPKERYFGDYSEGRFAWFFRPEIKVISPPIRVRGYQGLWNWEDHSCSEPITVFPG